MHMTVSRIVRTSGSVPEDRKVRLIQTYLVICHLASCRKKTVSMFQDISYIKIHVKSDEILHTGRTGHIIRSESQSNHFRGLRFCTKDRNHSGEHLTAVHFHIPLQHIA